MNKKHFIPYLTNLYIKKKEEKIKRKEHNIFIVNQLRKGKFKKM